jgi:hypothetical protein
MRNLPTIRHILHCKKGYRFLRKLFLARESLVSDIPAGEEEIANLFLQCRKSFFPTTLTSHHILLKLRLTSAWR